MPLALPPPAPLLFFALPSVVATGAGVEAASEALSKDEACRPASSPVEDGGDEASLTGTSFSSTAGASWGNWRRTVDDSLRTMVRLGGVVVFFDGVGMMMMR